MRDLGELIDELTDAERASVTLSVRLDGASGAVSRARPPCEEASVSAMSCAN